MTGSPNKSINEELACFLYGHNYVLKNKASSSNEIYVCKSCQKEFNLEHIENFSGFPEKVEFISLIRRLLKSFNIKNNQIIS